jgi:hypothetical protein
MNDAYQTSLRQVQCFYPETHRLGATSKLACRHFVVGSIGLNVNGYYAG